MRKSWYYLLFLLIVVSACGKHSTKPEKLLQVSAESLATATAMQSQQLELVELRIREMAKNPAIGEIARRIEARIKRITILTNAAQQQIKNLREQLTREQQANRKTTVSPDWTDKASLLYTQLALFRDSVLNADWALKTEFGSNFPLLGLALDSLINSDKELSEFLLNASYSTAFAWLSNVEFNLIHAGWKCATYCFESFAYDGGCDSGPNVIISQNPQVVLPEATIAVGFGMGIFPYGNRYRMEASVNGGPSKLLQNGVESIEIKADRKAGHYKVPLTITYLDQDGKRQEIRKMIEYTVVDTICAPDRSSTRR